MALSDAIRAQINRPEGAEMVVVNVRNEEAFDPTSHVLPRGTLFLLTEGLVAVETRQGRFVAGPRSIGWMPPGAPHAVQSYGPTAGFGAFLRPDLCVGLPAHPANFQATALAVLVLQRAVGWPIDSALAPAQRRLVLVLLDELRQASAQPLQLPWPEDERLLAVARALLANPASPRRLQQWARFAEMSPRSLSRKFVQETGMTFARWRQWARLIQSLEWLAEGQAVKSVSLSLGYSSVSAFIKVFREALGSTPAAYFQSRAADAERAGRRDSQADPVRPAE